MKLWLGSVVDKVDIISGQEGVDGPDLAAGIVALGVVAVQGLAGAVALEHGDSSPAWSDSL